MVNHFCSSKSLQYSAFTVFQAQFLLVTLFPFIPKSVTETSLFAQTYLSSVLHFSFYNPATVYWVFQFQRYPHIISVPKLIQINTIITLLYLGINWWSMILPSSTTECFILNIECVTHFKKLVIICNISGLQGIYFMKTVNILECEGNETREISVEYKILMLLIPYPVVCDDSLS